MAKLILIMGFPGSGKTSEASKLISQGYTRINRDMYDTPGKVCSSGEFHEVYLQKLMKSGIDVVVDNTYPTIESRKTPIALAAKYGYDIELWEMGTTIEQTEYNVATRMMQRYGKLVEKEESAATKADSNIFGPFILFNYQKKYEQPTVSEGFKAVKKLKFNRIYDPTYTGKAIILDYDSTLRICKSGAKCPNDPKDVIIMPNRKRILQKYKDEGYLLLGVSNQAGIARGLVTEERAIECFERTNNLLGLDIKYKYCKHNIPINCYCRKPMPGRGVEFIETYKLDPRKCIMVGDMTSDKTFAKRCGFQYSDEKDFFK